MIVEKCGFEIQTVCKLVNPPLAKNKIWLAEEWKWCFSYSDCHLKKESIFVLSISQHKLPVGGLSKQCMDWTLLALALVVSIVV